MYKVVLGHLMEPGITAIRCSECGFPVMPQPVAGLPGRCSVPAHTRQYRHPTYLQWVSTNTPCTGTGALAQDGAACSDCQCIPQAPELWCHLKGGAPGRRVCVFCCTRDCCSRVRARLLAPPLSPNPVEEGVREFERLDAADRELEAVAVSWALEREWQIHATKQREYAASVDSEKGQWTRSIEPSPLLDAFLDSGYRMRNLREAAQRLRLRANDE